MKTIITIETAPLPKEEIEGIMPKFEAPSNYKDQAKIDAFIAEAQAKFIEKAALDPMTGRIVGIGVLPIKSDGSPGEETIIASLDPEMEPIMVDALMGKFSADECIAWYARGFLTPFLFRRAWKLGVTTAGSDPDEVIDLSRRWRAGDGIGYTQSLESVAAFLLNQPTTVDPFVHEQLAAGEHQKAVDQIHRKLFTIYQVAQKMGVVPIPEATPNPAI